MSATQAQWLTVGFVGLITAAVLLFDAWISLRYGTSASISRVFCRLADLWPTAAVAVIFWLGVLVGHCWLPAR